jgi:predicted dehydrogenase
MSHLRVGVIGVGVMGERHCRVYSSLRGINVVGIADLNAERGRAVAAQYGTRYFENHRDLLREVSAVSIVTPTPAHFHLVMEALEQGVHVLVEKPLAETLEQGEHMVAEAEKRNRLLQVGHIERFNPTYIELKNVIEGMRLIAINTRRLSPFDLSNTDVDVIRDLMVHDLDLVADLAGKRLEGINAWGRSMTTGAIDHAVANLSFRDGPIVTLFASRITEQKVRLIEVIAEGAYIEADLLSKSILVHRRTLPQYLDNHQLTKYRQESIIERIYVPMAEPLMLELRHFVECVSEDKPSRVPGVDGLYALRLAQAVADQANRLMRSSSMPAYSLWIKQVDTGTSLVQKDDQHTEPQGTDIPL